MASEEFLGSDATGLDGATNRVLATSGAGIARGSILVFSDGQFLRETSDFTISGNNITFLIKLWNETQIDVRYVQ